jgi:hypothetical protein
MVLEYVALALLLLSVALCVYGVVAVWGIPYEIAKRRDHPHRDAIGAATWICLFTVGALWPFLWIWAMMYRPDRERAAATGPEADSAFSRLEERVAALERMQRKG